MVISLERVETVVKGQDICSRTEKVRKTKLDRNVDGCDVVCFNAADKFSNI
jgi:hypothetical protein